MKKFVTGFILGAIICSMIGAFAVSYVAEPVAFKVMVNGEEFVSDNPALAINGSTYLPLKATGEVLGVPVKWNSELFQVEVGDMSSSENTLLNGFKTYAESKEIIDFGDFCSSSPCKDVETTDEKTIYWYEYDTVDYVLDYIEEMEENGYKLMSMDKGLFTSCLLKDTKDSKKPGIIIGFGQPDLSSLDMYVSITILK